MTPRESGRPIASHRSNVYRGATATRSSTAPVWGFVIIVSLMITAAVLLARAGLPVEQIAGILTAVGAAAGAAQIALVKLSVIETRQRDIGQQTAQIERRTNGELTATVHAAVHQAVGAAISDHRLRPVPRPRPTGTATPVPPPAPPGD